MLLETLAASELNEKMVILALRIIVEEIGISSLEYVEFNQRIKDDEVHKALYDIRSEVFINEAR